MAYPGTNGGVNAIVSWDPDGPGPATSVLVLAGSFTEAGEAPASRIATWDGGQWSPLGLGTNATIWTLAVLPSGELVAGGDFSTAGGLPAARIARWDGSAWAPLGGGFNGTVRSLEVLTNGDLVAGGTFTVADGVACNRVARWSGTSWSAVGTGADQGGVLALAELANGDLVAAGSFTSVGGVPMRVARFDGTGWSALAATASSSIEAMSVLPNGDLVAAGGFVNLGGVAANRIARWDGNAWSSLGSGLSAGVDCLAVLADGDVVVGGAFTTAGGVPASRLARWDGVTWSSVGPGVPSAIDALCVAVNGDLIVGGGSLNFVYDSDGSLMPCNRAGRWDGVRWQPLGLGCNGDVTTIGYWNGLTIVGGAFTGVGGIAASRIAAFDGTNWSKLGGGLNNTVFATWAMTDGSMVVAGAFTTAGGSPANRIARWDGTSWSPLGSGMNNTIRALWQMPNGDLVAAGAFTTAGGVSASRVARWDGTAWFPLGSGIVGSSVFCLGQTVTGDLIVGGDFATAGGSVVNNLARWDGSSWSGYGSGVSSAVYSISLWNFFQGEFLIGGSFHVGGSQLALWNGASFVPFAGGVSGIVFAMSWLPDGDLAIGGDITAAGGAPANRLARWDGTNWQSLGGVGVDGRVNAIGQLRGDPSIAAFNGPVVVGGAFQNAGGLPASRFATLSSSCAGQTVRYGNGCVGSVGTHDLEPSNVALVGDAARSRAFGFPPNSLAFVLWGAAPIAVPMQLLFPNSAVGCNVLVDAVDIQLGVPPFSPMFTSLAIPDSPAVAGFQLYEQVVFWEVDSQGMLADWTSSNGLRFTVGVF